MRGGGEGGGALTDIGEELLELLRLLVEPVLVAHEGEELGLELGVQAGDHQLHRVPDLPHTLILRLKGCLIKWVRFLLTCKDRNT